DYRGGGRFSGRITAGFVAAGYFAKKVLGDSVKMKTYAKEVGGVELRGNSNISKLVKNLKGDSVGGIIEFVAENLPIGFGEPVFDTVEGEIAKAVFSVPAVKGIEFGAGFELARMKGIEANDEFYIKDKRIETKTNNSGGILGGITNGMPLVFRVVVKPTPSISIPQKSVDLVEMREKKILIEGRHDPCIAFRAVPVIEAVACIVLADLYLRYLRGVCFEDERVERKDR
ncbi:MAG: chorismate synthase, partial [Candidatus Methanofastidiosia archaeon]